MMTPLSYGASVEDGDVVYIFPTKGSSIKRRIRKADEEGRLFDARAGRKSRSVLVVIKDKVITLTLTAADSDTLRDKINEGKLHGKKKRALKNKLHSTNSGDSFSEGIEESVLMTKNS